MNFQDASNLRIPEGYVRTIHDKDSRLLWGSVGYDVSFDGNATQTTYSGKNLLPFTNQDYTLSGVRVYAQDGELYLNGTATANVSSNANYWKTSFAFTLPAGTYTLGASEYTFAQGEQFWMHDENQADLAVLKSTTARTATFTLATDTNVYLGIFWANGNVFNNKKISITLNSGSTAQPYERYVGGIPAPNPDYPQPISVVTGEQTVKVTGKNLLPVLNIQRTTHGVTFTPNADGSVTVNGTATDNATYFLNANQSWGVYTIPLEGGKAYTINGRNSGGVLIQAGVRPIGSGSSATMYPIGTFTPPTDSEAYAYIRVSSGTTINNQTFYVQLEQGSQPTQFEQYQGQEVEVNFGKNLISPRTPIGTTTVDEDGKITYNATATTSYINLTNGSDPLVVPAGNYTFSISQAQSAQIALRFLDSNGATINTFTIAPGTTSISFTLSEPSSRGYFYLRQTTANTHYSGSFYPQLEKGSTVTPFAPYSTPIELAKIGAYLDRIYKTNGKWYVEKQVGKVVYDGTESWQGQSMVSGMNYYRLMPQDAKKNNDILLNNQGIGRTFGSQDVGVTPGSCFVSASGNLNFLAPEFASSTDFKNHLASSNMTVYYALATPTTTEITDATLIAQLEAVYDWVRRHGYNASVIGDLPIVISRTALPTV